MVVRPGDGEDERRAISFALILAPSFFNRLYPAILLLAFVGEASLCLWLLVKGVNVEKWNARASGGK